MADLLGTLMAKAWGELPERLGEDILQLEERDKRLPEGSAWGTASKRGLLTTRWGASSAMVLPATSLLFRIASLNFSATRVTVGDCFVPTFPPRWTRRSPWGFSGPR